MARSVAWPACTGSAACSCAAPGKLCVSLGLCVEDQRSAILGHVHPLAFLYAGLNAVTLLTGPRVDPRILAVLRCGVCARAHPSPLARLSAVRAAAISSSFRLCHHMLHAFRRMAARSAPSSPAIAPRSLYGASIPSRRRIHPPPARSAQATIRANRSAPQARRTGRGRRR